MGRLVSTNKRRRPSGARNSRAGGDSLGSGGNSGGCLRCSGCEAICFQGRWRWPEQLTDTELAAAGDAATCLCPACRRVRDHYPGGLLMLSGPYFEGHQEQILDLITYVEGNAKREHPLQRIMSRTRQDRRLVIAFTDAHLALAVGEALRRAWHGELSVVPGVDASFLRVNWHC